MRVQRWVERHYRMALWVFGLSGYIAGIEATGWPTAAKAGLMAAGTLFGGSEVIINLINNRDLEREIAELRRERAADKEENVKLREENAWLRREREMTRRERRGRYRRNRGLGLGRNRGE